MTTKNEYLDKAKEMLEISSDYQLAREIGVERSIINHYRKDRAEFSEYVAFQLAEILKIEPTEIIANREIKKEKDKFKRDFWLEKLKEYGQVATLTAGALTFTALPHHTDFNNNDAPQNERMGIM